MKSIEHYVQGVMGLTKAALGIMKAPEDVILKRRGICNACEHKIIVNSKMLGGMVGKCELCTCNIKAKTLLSDEECYDKPPRWNKL